MNYESCSISRNLQGIQTSLHYTTHSGYLAPMGSIPVSFCQSWGQAFIFLKSLRRYQVPYAIRCANRSLAL